MKTDMVWWDENADLALEADAEEAALSWILAYKDEFLGLDFDRPWRETFANLCDEVGFIGSISFLRHDV